MNPEQQPIADQRSEHFHMSLKHANEFRVTMTEFFTALFYEKFEQSQGREDALRIINDLARVAGMLLVPIEPAPGVGAAPPPSERLPLSMGRDPQTGEIVIWNIEQLFKNSIRTNIENFDPAGKDSRLRVTTEMEEFLLQGEFANDYLGYVFYDPAHALHPGNFPTPEAAPADEA